MSDLSVDFDRLPVRFPFLGWPRFTARNAKVEFLLHDRFDFNFCQIFRTDILDPKHPMRFLMAHLRSIEHSLRYGVRHSIHPAGGGALITITGGLQWWMENGVVRPEPRLAVFSGRGLMYRPAGPAEWKGGHAFSPGCWLSDVGLLPL